MKKTFLALSLMSFVLFSCSSRSENKDIQGNWIEIIPSNPDIVQGFNLANDGKATSIGMETLKYEGWQVEGDTIILSARSIGTGLSFDFLDTLRIVNLSSDSMELKPVGREGHVVRYYKVADVKDIKPFNVLDSLRDNISNKSRVQTRIYSGSLAVESCVEVRNMIYFYNYEGVADGVYKLTSQYIRGEGQDPTSNEYGRYYVLKGSADDKNAVVYQLVPFGGGDKINFLYDNAKLVMLDQQMNVVKNVAGQPSVFVE